MSGDEKLPGGREPEPWIEPGHTYASVTDKIASAVLTRPLGVGWLLGFAFLFGIVMMLNPSYSCAQSTSAGVISVRDHKCFPAPIAAVVVMSSH